MLIYWARLFDYCTYWTNFQNNYLFVHCHILGKIIQLLYIDGTTFQCAIIGKYCWIIYEERLEWLEPWQVSLGGEHYLFPEPHYFMNISKTNLILLWPILICFTLHTLLFGLSDSEGNLRGIRQWAEGKTFSGQVKVLTLITSLKLGSNADLDFHKITLPFADTWIKHIIINLRNACSAEMHASYSSIAVTNMKLCCEKYKVTPGRKSMLWTGWNPVDKQGGHEWTNRVCN